MKEKLIDASLVFEYQQPDPEVGINGGYYFAGVRLGSSDDAAPGAELASREVHISELLLRNLTTKIEKDMGLLDNPEYGGSAADILLDNLHEFVETLFGARVSDISIRITKPQTAKERR